MLQLRRVEVRVRSKTSILLYTLISTYTLLYVGYYLLGRTPLKLADLLLLVYPPVNVELVTTIHNLFLISTLTVLAYFLIRVSTSKAMLTVTIAYLYSNILNVGTQIGWGLYLYLLTMILLASSTSHGRSLKMNVGVLKSKPLLRIYSLMLDYGLIAVFTLAFSWTILNLTFTFRDYVLKYSPQPYQYIFGNLLATRFGALIFNLVVFMVFIWLLREVLELPALHLSISPSESFRMIRSEISREVERLSLEPKLVVTATSIIAGLLISYALWFIIYPKLLGGGLLLIFPQPVRQVLTFLTIILTSIVLDRIIKSRMLAGLKPPGKPSYKPVIYSILLLAIIMLLLHWVGGIDVYKFSTETLLGKPVEDPLSGVGSFIDENLGLKFNERVRDLEEALKAVIRILWS